MIQIQYSVDMLGWCVYKYEQGSDGRRYYRDRDGGTITPKEGERIEPLLIIEDLEEFAEAISKVGIKPKSDYKLEGILEATKDHLEDMRALVFSAKKKRKPTTKSKEV